MRLLYRKSDNQLMTDVSVGITSDFAQLSAAIKANPTSQFTDYYFKDIPPQQVQNYLFHGNQVNTSKSATTEQTGNILNRQLDTVQKRLDYQAQHGDSTSSQHVMDESIKTDIMGKLQNGG